jgi:hypothetical protein
MNLAELVNPMIPAVPRRELERAATEPENRILVNFRKVLATTRSAYGLMPGAAARINLEPKTPRKARRPRRVTAGFS